MASHVRGATGAAVSGVDLEVHVRAGRVAGVAAVGDGLAGHDDLTDGDEQTAVVRHPRDAAVPVLDLDHVAVALVGPAGEDDAAGRHGADGGAGRGREVLRRVHLAPAEAVAGGQGVAGDWVDPAAGQRRSRASPPRPSPWPSPWRGSSLGLRSLRGGGLRGSGLVGARLGLGGRLVAGRRGADDEGLRVARHVTRGAGAGAGCGRCGDGLGVGCRGRARPRCWRRSSWRPPRGSARSLRHHGRADHLPRSC